MVFLFSFLGGEPDGEERTQQNMGAMQDEDSHISTEVSPNKIA